MGKKKGGGGGGNDDARRKKEEDNRKAAEARQKAEAAQRQAREAARRKQDDDNRRKQQENANRKKQEDANRKKQQDANRKKQQDDANRKKQQDDANRKAAEAKQKAQAAKQQSSKSKGNSSPSKGGGSQQVKGGGQQQSGGIKQAVQQVGSTLNKKDIKGLQQQGYSSKQINKVAGKVNQVGQGAQSLLDRVSSGKGGNGIQPTVKAGVRQVGDKLSKGEAKDLKRDGYSLKQITKIAGKVDAVKPGAEKKITRWQDKAAAAKQVASAAQHRPSAPSSSGASAINDLLNTTPSTPAPAPKPEPPAPSGGSYGTADRDGWLAAELNAIDTFEPDLEPTLFNNYRPTDLSDQLRDAVSEANSFIDNTRSSWGSSSSAAVKPTVVQPRSLLDEEERERWGLSA